MLLRLQVVTAPVQQPQAQPAPVQQPEQPAAQDAAGADGEDTIHILRQLLLQVMR